MRKTGHKHDLIAEKQRRYRELQKLQGIPTSSAVAMATFRVLMSMPMDAKAQRLADKVEDLVIAYLLERNPHLTERGIARRFEEMTDEAVRRRDGADPVAHGRNGDTEERC